MFTPPASPAPPRTLREESPLSSDSGDSEAAQYLLVPEAFPLRCTSVLPLEPKQPSPADQYASSETAKQRVGRRTRWTILLVPLVLVLITVSTRYISHPAILDVFSADHETTDRQMWLSTLSDWRPHKRHASPDPMPQDGGSQTIAFPTSTSTNSSLILSTSPTPTSGSSADQPLPTIPSAPPVLPTPFPQPLDSTMSRNFQTQQCLNFFNNMTQSATFRSCRPFSLLLVQSSAFIQAQGNITALNDILWGTCNTDTSSDQCNANMGWFVENIQDACSQDIKAQNAVVTETRDGLLAYTLMRDAACQADQSTNAYCYVEAVHNSNPADEYFYNLPFGIALPNNTAPSCSACTKSIMSLYSQWQNLTALNDVYNGAATIANQKCGTGFVTLTGAVSSASAHVEAPILASVTLILSALWMLGW